MMKAESVKLIESLKKWFEILNKQITTEEKNNETKISIERSDQHSHWEHVTSIPKKKIHKLEERDENGGVEELKKMVFGFY